MRGPQADESVFSIVYVKLGLSKGQIYACSHVFKLSTYVPLSGSPQPREGSGERDSCNLAHVFSCISVQGSAKRLADFVKQQPGSARQKS